MTVLELPRTLSEKVDYLLQPVVTRPSSGQSLPASEAAAWKELIDK